MITQINKISQSTKKAILRKSAQTLPDNPSEQGFGAEEIKGRLYNPITDTTNSVVTELDRIVGEINLALEEVEQAISEGGGGTVRSVSGVFPDENRDVPLIVFQKPLNPQLGQLLLEALEEEPAQTQIMGYTVEEEQVTPEKPKYIGYTVTEEPVTASGASGYTIAEETTGAVSESTFANETYNEYVFTNNEVIENYFKE